MYGSNDSAAHVCRQGDPFETFRHSCVGSQVQLGIKDEIKVEPMHLGMVEQNPSMQTWSESVHQKERRKGGEEGWNKGGSKGGVQRQRWVQGWQGLYKGFTRGGKGGTTGWYGGMEPPRRLLDVWRLLFRLTVNWVKHITPWRMVSSSVGVEIDSAVPGEPQHPQLFRCILRGGHSLVEARRCVRNRTAVSQSRQGRR